MIKTFYDVSKVLNTFNNHSLFCHLVVAISSVFNVFTLRRNNNSYDIYLWSLPMTMELSTNLFIEGNITKAAKKLSDNDKGRLLSHYPHKRIKYLQANIWIMFTVQLEDGLPLSFYETLNESLVETGEQVGK